MKPRIGLTAALFAGALLLGTVASATVPMTKQYADYYKEPRPKCNLCHTVNPKLNDYGTALKQALNGAKVITPEMFKACEAKRQKP